MKPIWVLMWKQKRERMRRPFHTLWETLSGCSLFVILLALKQFLLIESTNLEPPAEKIVDVVYTPNTSITRSLLSGICKEKRNGSDNTSTTIRCYGVNNETDVNNILNENKEAFEHTIAIIDFENINDTEVPDTLKYNIRLWDADAKARQTSILADLYRLYGDDYDDLYTSQNVTLLTSLQWQLDKAYLEKLSGELIHHHVNVHGMAERISTYTHLVNSFLKVCMILAPLPYFMYENSSKVIKKKTGMKELLKLYGVSNNTIRNSNLLTTTFFGTIYAIVVTILLKITYSPILKHSNWFIIAVTLVFHFVCIVSLAFITSSIAQNYQHCDSLALLIYVLTFIINILLYRRNSIADYLVCAIIPHAPVFVFWDEVTTLELKGIGAQFNNMWTSQGSKHIASIFVVWVFFMLQIFLIVCLSWYLDAVKPGMYGIALPWNFLCHRKYWIVVKKKIRKKQVKGVNFHVTAEGHNLQKDNRYFEAQREGTPIAIKIAGVTKIFRNFKEPDCHALENIDLEVHKGEITVLLGVNGAGKSTLLSIVTGMFSATQGKVYINGFDNSARLHDLRKDLGYCPQREMTFEYLTVMENIYFFQQLKGDTIASATKDHLMRALDLVTVGDFYTKELPTGMKRALQIVCALVGDADVLVLDEPTAGMDSKMRHKVWDLLLALRKYKTLLVSTTVMREADAIGDRIAIINRGSLKCHGSPAFLKSAIGADFKLSLRVAEGMADRLEIQQIIDKNLSDVNVTVNIDMNQLMRSRKSRISVSLPSNDRGQFPKVFDILEAKMRDLGITMMDVGISMEQVFLSFIEQDEDLLGYEGELLYEYEERKKGFKLHMYQLYVLMERVFTFVWFHKYQFVLLQVLVPFIAFILVTASSNTPGAPIKAALRTSKDIPNATVVYHPIGYRRLDVFNPLIAHYPHVKFVASDNLQEDFHKSTYKTKFGYKMSGDRTDIFYTAHPSYRKNVASAAINIFSNMFMSLHMPYASKNHHILTSTTPMQMKSNQGFKNLYLCLGWAMWIVFLSVVPIAPLILLCIEEYYKGVRFTHLHLSVPPYIIWLGKLIPHMAIYTAIVPTSVLLVSLLLDADNTFNQGDFLLCILVFLMMFGPAFLIFWYVISFAMSERHVITKIYMSSLTFGIIFPILTRLVFHISKNVFPLRAAVIVIVVLAYSNPIFVLAVYMYRMVFNARKNAFCRAKFHMCPNFPIDSFVTEDICCGFVFPVLINLGNRMSIHIPPLNTAVKVVEYLLSANPTFVLALRMYKAVYYARNNALCRVNFHECPDFPIDSFVKKDICCGSKDGAPYHYNDIMFSGFVVLLVLTVLYWIILMLLQRRKIQKIWEHIVNYMYKAPEKRCTNLRVKAEEEVIRNKFKEYEIQPREVRQRDYYTILADDLHRVFRLGYGKPIYAVRGISLAVERGHCLGIFGRNGAGKSTTLGMVSGFLVMTRGRSCVNGFSLKNHRQRYLQRVSWAAADGMDEFLSGYKNLKILAALHGHSRKMSCKMAMSNLNYLGLTSHAHQLFSSYSSGCSHLLAVAKSLISEASAVLLDEPLGSVDPHTRPLIVSAIRRLRDQGVACLIAEESMEWTQIDSLFDRMAIIDQGEIVALGSVEEIRRELTSGYTATLKLNVDEAYRVITDSLERLCSMGNKGLIPSDKVSLLKKEFSEIFETSLLIDEHISMLYFHIGDPKRELPYSEMFRKLESLRQKYDVVEDYTLSETTVDEVLQRIDHILHGRDSKHVLSKKILTLDTKSDSATSQQKRETV